MSQPVRIRSVGIFFVVLLLAACGEDIGGGGASSSATPAATPDAPTQQVTGTLSAPGGTLAFNAPTGFRRFFAEIFGRSAVAALPGTAGVAGARVRLIEIDTAGAQVGADIATAVSAADGSFTLNVPASFTPGPRFVIRGAGTTENIDRLMTDLGTQDIDPASHATKSLVLASLLAAAGNIQNLSALQVEELGNQLAQMVDDMDSVSANLSGLIAAFTAEAQNDEEANHALNNLAAAGFVTGTVTDSAGTPLANIKVVARDFNQFLVRAVTRTNANGQYRLHLTPGDYVAGAMNFTAASMGASEWWTCNDVAAGPACGAANVFGAGRVTVGAGATAVNFKLEPGARVEGSATAAVGGAPLPGVNVSVRDFLSDEPAAFTRARIDGGFRINIRPGTYTVGARNKTRRAFAGGLYNGPAAGGTATGGGGESASEATPLTFAAGTTYTVNLPLIEGGVLRGLVTDGATPTPNPVTGISVRTYQTTATDDTGRFVEAVPSNRIGAYRMWVRPGTYSVRSRGQQTAPLLSVVAFSSNPTPAPVSFGAAVGRATAIVQGPGNVPLSQVKVSVYDGSSSATFQGFEITNGDGSVELYAQPTGNYRLEYKVDNGSTTIGSAIHDGTATPTLTRLLGGMFVAFDTAAASPVALGTITLPAGGELKGVVTVGGTPTGNIVVQLRSGGFAIGARFTATRTQGDGTYSISVPAATYTRVCAFVAGTSGACPTNVSSAGIFASANNVLVTAGVSNTLNIAIP